MMGKSVWWGECRVRRVCDEESIGEEGVWWGECMVRRVWSEVV